MLLFIILPLIKAQNVGVGISSPKAKLHIKGNADTSKLVIDANATQSNNHPLIRLRTAGGTDLLHIHSDDVNNTFVGLNAGSGNNAGGGGLGNTFIGAKADASNTTGYSLNAVGQGALFSNTSGNKNTAIGPSALYYNTTGFNNVATGRGALYQNMGAHNNTATGFKSLFSNTTGIWNTGIGSMALQSNIDGLGNTATYFQSLYKNIDGGYNTAFGWYSLQFNTTGYGNTAVGAGALYGNVTGDYNTVVGNDAGISNDRSNSTVIGNGAHVNTSNKIRFGNSSVTVIEGQVAYSFPSDARFKYNIKNNVPSLDFIKKIRPVTYYLDEQKLDAFTQTGVINKSLAGQTSLSATKQLHTGLLAQNVEKTANELGYSFDGVHAPANDRDHYSIIDEISSAHHHFCWRWRLQYQHIHRSR